MAKFKIDIFPAVNFFMLLSCIISNAQTNVSGGIFVNTTWTLANSPYIVTDTVVVFPNVTLTIEPGVTVKFVDNKYLEVRQSSILALGTETDSITFTSNSVSPSAGSWLQIIQTGAGHHTCKFSYCNFRYATCGFFEHADSILSDSVFVKHSNFEFNVTGLHGNGRIDYVDSSIFSQNTQHGLYSVSDVNHSIFIGNNIAIINGLSTIENCLFDNNQLGIFGSIITATFCVFRNNQTGMHIVSGGSLIDNCTINNNQTGIFMEGFNTIKNSVIVYNSIVGIKLYGTGAFGHVVNNCQIKHNNVGIFDSLCVGSAITENQIDSNTIGIELKSYQDTISCNSICDNSIYDLEYLAGINSASVPNNFWCTSDSVSITALIYDGHDNISYGLVNFMPIDTIQCYLNTGISINDMKDISISVLPNPAFDILYVVQNNNDNSEFLLYDITSKILFQQKFINSASIDIEHLGKGIYIYEVRNKNGLIKKGKIVKD